MDGDLFTVWSPICRGCEVQPDGHRGICALILREETVLVSKARLRIPPLKESPANQNHFEVAQ